MRVGSLFAGIGGFDLAAERVGWTTAWFSEIDPYASAVLKHHWPHVPNHGDITTIDFTRVEPVEVLCGGFPCQDISTAGVGNGIDGPRSGLWSHYARAIGELRPRYVVVENVPALLARGLDRVLGELVTLGYDAEWDCIPAAALGAPHLRDRLWIVAYPQSHGRPSHSFFDQGHLERGRVASTAWSADRYILTTDDAGEVWCLPASRAECVADGVSSAMEQLGGYGNAIVPQVAEAIFRGIIAHEQGVSAS